MRKKKKKKKKNAYRDVSNLECEQQTKKDVEKPLESIVISRAIGLLAQLLVRMYQQRCVVEQILDSNPYCDRKLNFGWMQSKRK